MHGGGSQRLGRWYCCDVTFAPGDSRRPGRTLAGWITGSTSSIGLSPETYEWLHQVAERDDFDDLNRAYHVLRAVLHALRDRVEPNVAAHVAAQLPSLVRGIFYEGWDPAKVRIKELEQEASARHVRCPVNGGKFKETARAVMTVCRAELGEGTMGHLISVLPSDFAVLM